MSNGPSVTRNTMKTAHRAVHGGRHLQTSLSRLPQRWGLPGSGLPQWCGVALAATGTFALASLIPFIAAGRPTTAQFPLNVLYAPAWFLFDSFLWFALLIPALCYAYVFVLFSERVTPEVPAALVAVGLVLPVLSILAHVVAATDRALAAVALVAAFGRVPAAILLLLVLILEGVAGFALLQHWRRREQRQPAPAAPAEPPTLAEPIGQVPAPSQPAAAVTANGSAPATAGHNGSARSEPAQSEPARSEPAQSEPARSEPAPSEPAPSEPAQSEPAPPVAEAPEAASDALEELQRLFPDTAATEQANGASTSATAPEAQQPESSPSTAKRSAPRGGRSRPRSYRVPLDILDVYEPEAAWQVDNDTREAAATLMATLAEFKIDAEVTGIRRGPVITMFELLPAPGVKISRIVNLADNIALRLAASRVRIVAPIPGKHAVGIEVPNRRRAVVSFREIVSLPQFKPDPKGLPTGVPIVLGKDITGEAQVFDLTATPHLLIAGATGAGKSVLVNALICSVLYSRTPEQVRLLLIDPKIVELKLYNDVPHLLTPVITDPKRAFQALQYCLYEMDRRYALLDNLGVRDINSYNRRLLARDERVTVGPLPYLVIVIDEFADLMATTGKELESTLARLAAMARAVGIHIVLATQRPSIDVITGLIKANIPSRIAFMVASKFDSRIIIDAVGAEKLLGRGDMLFVPAWDANPMRIQGALVSEEEVELVAEKVRELGEPDYIDEDLLFDDEESELVLEPGGNDPLMDQALEVVAGAGKASASYLQRKLKIGYNRAARLVEEMEQRGIVGPANGSKPREILHLPSRD